MSTTTPKQDATIDTGYEQPPLEQPDTSPSQEPNRGGTEREELRKLNPSWSTRFDHENFARVQPKDFVEYVRSSPLRRPFNGVVKVKIKLNGRKLKVKVELQCRVQDRDFTIRYIRVHPKRCRLGVFKEMLRILSLSFKTITMEHVENKGLLAKLKSKKYGFVEDAKRMDLHGNPTVVKKIM